MTKPLGPALDPSPHRPLPSDVAFTLWLRTLQPSEVERDRVARSSFIEERYLDGAGQHRKQRVQ